jgi:hypothetical protein
MTHLSNTTFPTWLVGYTYSFWLYSQHSEALSAWKRERERDREPEDEWTTSLPGCSLALQFQQVDDEASRKFSPETLEILLLGQHIARIVLAYTELWISNSQVLSRTS